MEDAAQSVGIVATQTLRIPEPLHLECGRVLEDAVLAYETYGTLNADRSNAILLLHALSGDAHAAGYHAQPDGLPVAKPGWWDMMVGPGKGFDTNKYFVICSNVIGGCMGSTGPTAVNPATGKPYGLSFPIITIGDMVLAQQHLVNYFGIDKLLAVAGGSMGGMQALEWATRHSHRTKAAIVIASTHRLSPQAIAFDAVGRHAILADPHFNGGDYYDSGEGPDQGLSIARMIGHITYLSDESMRSKFGRKLRSSAKYKYDFSSEFSVETYLDYQGEQFTNRFDANSYLYLTKAIDYFDVIKDHGEFTAELAHSAGVALDTFQDHAQDKGLADPMVAVVRDAIQKSLADQEAHATAVPVADATADHEQSGLDRAITDALDALAVAGHDAEMLAALRRAMDEAHEAAMRAALDNAMAKVNCRMLVTSYTSDWLYPPYQSQEIVRSLIRKRRDVTYCNITSALGHDAFLIQDEMQPKLVGGFLEHTANPDKVLQPEPLEVGLDDAASPEPWASSSIYDGHRVDYENIVAQVAQGSRVLDIGCGDGALLQKLITEKQVQGFGMDLDEKNIVKCARRGVNAVLGDANEDLRYLPDNSYDYIVLSMTLQVIKRPDMALNEMLRVGKRCVVSFPNFGFWKVRTKTLVLGRAPITRNLPYAWYVSPNRHVLSIKDFREYCDEKGIRIEREVPLSSIGWAGIARRWPNLFADEALFVISRE